MLRSLVPRQRQLLRAIWRTGRASRRDLHEQTGVRPNTVGADVAVLLKAGIVRECAGLPLGRGRPRVPLEIDPDRRRVIGVAVRPGRAEVVLLNLLGRPVEAPRVAGDLPTEQLVPAASRLLREAQDACDGLGIGITTPGIVDPVRRQIVTSAMSRDAPLDLGPLLDAARPDLPVTLENDMQALAARWLLSHQQSQHRDVLLVEFEDGGLGSALLIDGRPNRGCVTAANELGHTRFPVPTERCFCGGVGCVERIFSTAWLNAQDAPGGEGAGAMRGLLQDRVRAPADDDARLDEAIGLLAMSLSNAVIFTRVQELVLISSLFRGGERFRERLIGQVRDGLMGTMRQRVSIQAWDQYALSFGESAGWLPLAGLYFQHWSPAGRAAGASAGAMTAATAPAAASL